MQRFCEPVPLHELSPLQGPQHFTRRVGKQMPTMDCIQLRLLPLLVYSTAWVKRKARLTYLYWMDMAQLHQFSKCKNFMSMWHVVSKQNRVLCDSLPLLRFVFKCVLSGEQRMQTKNVSCPTGYAWLRAICCTQSELVDWCTFFRANAVC